MVSCCWKKNGGTSSSSTAGAPYVTKTAAAQDQNLQLADVLQSNYPVKSVCEVTGTKFFLSGDTNGYVTAWDLTAPEGSELVRYFECHEGSVETIFLLRSFKVPEFLEQTEWADGKAVHMRQVLQNTANYLQKCRTAQAGNQGGAKLAWTKEQSWNCVPQCLQRCFKPGDQEKDAEFKYVATASTDGRVKVWRWAIGEPKSKRCWSKDHHDTILGTLLVTEWDTGMSITACREMHCGTIAAAFLESSDVKLWDPVTCCVKWTCRGHSGPVRAVAECADGRLVSGGDEGIVMMWNKGSWEAENNSASDVRKIRHSALRLSALTKAGTSLNVDPSQGRVGVASCSYVAHSQEDVKGDNVQVRARIMVKRAEHLPRADFFGGSDPYVTCILVDGRINNKVHRTRSVRGSQPVWNHVVSLDLPYAMMSGKWALPENVYLSFEVHATSLTRKMRGKSTLMGRCTVRVGIILEEIKLDKQSAALPRSLQLHCGPGKKSDNSLEDKVLMVGFDSDSDRKLDVLIASADFGGFQWHGKKCKRPAFMQKTHVRVSIQGMGFQRQLPQSLKRSKVITRDINPVFDELFEIDLPAYQTDHRIRYSPSMSLLFEVWDYDLLNQDDLLGSVSIPLQDIHDNAYTEDARVKPYDLVVATEFSKKMKQDSPTPTIHLGFQLIPPCPYQVHLNILSASSLPSGGIGTTDPYIKVKLVEGDPTLPPSTAVQTATVYSTLDPVWNERCTFQLPTEYFEHTTFEGGFSIGLGGIKPTRMRNETDGKLMTKNQKRAVDFAGGGTVRIGNTHLPRIICFDIYDKDLVSKDDMLGRCTVDIDTVMLAIREDPEMAATPKPYPLKNSKLMDEGYNHAKSKLWLGFESEDDNITCIIERAEKVPRADLTGKSDPYVVVRVAEQTCFDLPSDEALLTYRTECQTPTISRTRNPVWNYKTVLDLPGVYEDDKVKFRPNTYLLFEVYDADIGNDDLLGKAVLPIEEIIQECRVERPTSAELKERIDGWRNQYLTRTLPQTVERPNQTVKDADKETRVFFQRSRSACG